MNVLPLESLTEVSLDTLLEESKSIINSVSENWSQDKIYPVPFCGTTIKVTTAHKSIKGNSWYSRSTSLDELPRDKREDCYKKLVKYLVGTLDASDFSSSHGTHSYYEQKYIHDLDSISIQSTPSGFNSAPNAITYLAQLVYKTPFPFKKRLFHELIYIVQDQPDEYYVISVPIMSNLFTETPALGAGSSVNARYSSVERISFDKHSGSLIWCMATCSSPGGLIPDALANMSMNSIVVKDVPSFLNWKEKS
ncbi:hypothetical protein CAAN1_26S00848 [[Candida] anglica]|uniref:DUF3074 domain-containing protein n=1 Tax=[Candida] anglica TaxID=148631 RepID=A0ABP0EL33_9ASCO